jgi:hypothetical protein
MYSVYLYRGPTSPSSEHPSDVRDFTGTQRVGGGVRVGGSGCTSTERAPHDTGTGPEPISPVAKIAAGVPLPGVRLFDTTHLLTPSTPSPRGEAVREAASAPS